MSALGLSASFNFKAHEFALRWAKEHLPEEKYREINHSYNRTLKRTLLFVVLCFVPIVFAFCAFVIAAPFSSQAEANATPAGATGYVLARVDYDGNFYWTHDSKVYEHPLAEYGLDAESYQFGDKLKVYTDDAQNVLAVTEVQEGLSARDIEMLIGIAGAILVPLLITLCIYLPVAKLTFGKAWYTFCREYGF